MYFFLNFFTCLKFKNEYCCQFLKHIFTLGEEGPIQDLSDLSKVLTSKEEGKVDLEDKMMNTNQKWKQEVSDSLFRLKNEADSKYLSVTRNDVLTGKSIYYILAAL